MRKYTTHTAKDCETFCKTILFSYKQLSKHNSLAGDRDLKMVYLYEQNISFEERTKAKKKTEKK